MRRSSLKGQQGFVVASVVFVLAIIAVMALMITTSASLNNALVTHETDSATLDYVTEAGMGHAQWQLANNSSCTNHVDIPSTPFGAHSYSAAFTPTSGSPVAITAEGTLANGIKRPLELEGVKAYQPSVQLTLQPDAALGKDTRVYEWKSDWNFGTAANLIVGNETPGDWSNALIDFDLSAIPPSAMILSASLVLNQSSNGANGGNFSVHRVTTPWLEGNVMGGVGSPNWVEHEPGTAWTNPGGDFDPIAAATITVSTAVGPNQWEIDELVKNWVSGKSPNYGIAVVPASAGSLVAFSSSDHINSAIHPKLAVTYACECGIVCTGGGGVTPPAGSALLLVVDNPSGLSTQDTDKKMLIESWGYTVSLIDDNASQTEFDTAAAANSVAYVSATVFDTTLGTKLVNTSLGVVSEKANLVDEFGFSTSRTGSNQTTVSITNNSHYITSVFSPGVLALHSSPQPSFQLSGTLADGLVSLADGNGGDPGLAVLGPGATLSTGGTAAGRRVKLPWGGGAFDRSLLNADGETMMRRAIEWAAGAGASGGGAHYVELNQPWSETLNDTWKPVDLSGYGVPANAVVEVAMTNNHQSGEHEVGVRAIGSTLARTFYLHEAEAGGVNTIVVHVQTDSNSRIENFTHSAGFTAFRLLGYWSGAAYVEQEELFTTGASGVWQTHSLAPFGAAPGQIVEIVMQNSDVANEHQAGVRKAGSSNQRLVDLHKAEGGGQDHHSVFVEASTDPDASVEIYAEDHVNIQFRLVGAWSTPPGTYHEAMVDLGSAASDKTWNSLDLSGHGIPPNAVVQITLANRATGVQNDQGVRATNSDLHRVVDLHEAEDGGEDLVTMHVLADADSQIEWYHEDISDDHHFYLMGWWVVTP